ncbi:2,3-dihydro-2,3-dihydroxybenzoate dehydrogenase [Nocardiopsis mangrovi]|uniref:2,3-dihydro-2,3-dihydroxybenzoate dehydrogenase n=1 Tax=Nocardiopsis mangrovi TaxID=1179818 RepID=A0ABV9DSG6_9ACTN
MQASAAVVTGAGGGVGRAVAAALAAKGVPVAVADSDPATLAVTADKLAADGARVLPVPTDVRSPAQARALIDAAEEHLGPVAQLVNAAGVLHVGEACRLSDAQWEECIAVNATGVFAVSRAAAERMVPRRSGSIVTIASNAAGTARTGMGAYAASKAAAAMFTKCLGLELAERGIRCNVVAPGSTDTPMLRSMWSSDADRRATLDGSPGAYRVGIPLRRVASPDDVAAAALFLLSDAAAHITMHTLTVDGGATLGV